MRDDIIIRAARVEDVADIAAVHRHSFATAWDAKAIHGLLTHPAAIAFTAWGTGSGADGLAAIGFILAHRAADEAEILSLAVMPALRRKGIGGGLLTALLLHAQAAGARQIHLEVAASNLPALALYRAHGFVRVGVRPGYYVHEAGAREDAVRLKLDLVAVARA